MGRAHEVRAASMAKTAARKTKIYSRYGKEIYIAAKAGVPDPDMNLGLRRKIAEAKANQVPADVIKRAIEKAKGGSTETYNTIMYEGFGPKDATILVECMTDNPNRSIADVRTCFNKSHAKLGVGGSVSFNYESVGLVAFPAAAEDEEKILEALIMAECDAKEIEMDGGFCTITTEPSDLYKCKEAMDELYPELEYSTLELTMLPNEYTTLTDAEDLELWNRLLTMLDDVDDVQRVYHNVSAGE